MRVLITGATGFTGSYVLPLLLEKGFRVSCFVRPESDTRRLPLARTELVYGDLNDRESLKKALDHKDALVNIASLGFGHVTNIVDAAQDAGIHRAIFISTTAIFTSLNASSKGVRKAAEESIVKSRIAYTILRPTMIYGSSRDRNMCRLIRFLKRWPVLPILGNGENLQQPVYVGDVAQAVVDCLLKDRTIGRAYNIPGGKPLTFNEVIDSISGLLGRKTLKIHFPASPIISFLKFIEKSGLVFPIKSEQFMRLNEDKAFDFIDAASDFGYSPKNFEEGIALELAELDSNPV